MNKLSFFINLYKIIFHQTLFPIFIIISSTLGSIVLPYIVIHKNSILGVLLDEGFTIIIKSLSVIKWTKYEIPLFIGLLLIWGAISILYFNGDIYFGPYTLSGYRAVYRHTGFRFYIISMMLFVPLILSFSMLPLYQNYVTFTAYCSIYGWIISILLYIKGKFWPSPGVFNNTKNFIFDFFRGIELYPRIGKNLDIKTLVVSRFGLFVWQLIVLASWKAHYELYRVAYWQGDIPWSIAATSILQTIYLAKFYYWEDGYMATLDMALEHTGYYIVWGSITFVPSFYSLTSIYMVYNSPSNIQFNFIHFLITVIFGCLMIGCNYWTDRQKQEFCLTNGECIIWGKQAKKIEAMYIDEDGQLHKNLLLVSGFWSLARHINYLFEIALSFCFGVPALYFSSIPYIYFTFIMLFLIHRSFRDEYKCQKKYGKFWEEYCSIVPYRILPYVY